MKKGLVITRQFGFDNSDGLNIRYFNFLKMLTKYFEIDLFMFNNSNKLMLDIYKLPIKRIFLRSINKKDLFREIVKLKPHNLALYEPNIKEIILKEKYDFVYGNHYYTALNFINIEGVKKIVDMVDAVSLHYKETGFDVPLRKLYNIFMVNKVKKYEKKVIDNSDLCFVTSYVEKNYLVNELNVKESKIKVLGNGVENVYFEYNIGKSINNTIGFVGSLNYFPNIKAVERLIKIFKVAKNKKPDLKCLIIGKNPPRKLLKKKVDGLTFTGYVENLKEVMGMVDILVLPMKLASGVQNKLLTGLAAGKPVIISSRARFNEGLLDGYNVLFAENNNEFVEKIMFLYNNPDHIYLIAKRAREFALKNLDWSSIEKEFITSINKILEE